MNENETSTQTDPLSEAVGDYKADFPVLAADRLCEFTLKTISKRVSEKGTTTLGLKVELNHDSVFADGKPARKGFKFNHGINITPSGEYTIDSVKRTLSSWNRALLGTEAAKSTAFAEMRDNPDRFTNLVFKARTGIKKDKNGVYADQNTLTPVLPA